MASRLIDDDPAAAHEHALAASRRAGRVAVVRETTAITAYAVGDFALALRELRTHRRITGSNEFIALIVDSERGVGRPQQALEEGRSVERASLPTAVRVELAIALSGARLDLGETQRALDELDIPELDPDRAFPWSPGLFAARAAVLDELGRADEAAVWQHRAEVAADAIAAATGAEGDELIEIEELVDEENPDDRGPDDGDAPARGAESDDLDGASQDDDGASQDDDGASQDDGVSRDIEGSREERPDAETREEDGPAGEISDVAVAEADGADSAAPDAADGTRADGVPAIEAPEEPPAGSGAVEEPTDADAGEAAPASASSPTDSDALFDLDELEDGGGAP